jgi:putative ABC transport system permease protein
LAETRSVSAGYFNAMGLRIVRGRNFSEQDTPSSQPVAIVNEAFVKKFFPQGQDPLAQAFQQSPGRPNTAIVGVVRDVRQDVFGEERSEVDFPLSQLSEQIQRNIGSMSVALLVRTTVPATNIIPQLRKALLEVAPTVAFQTPETMDEVLGDALVTNRMQSWLFGIFAGIALLLAVIGVYGLLTQEVTSRIREIGVRMALGSTRIGTQIMIKHSFQLIALGLVFGVFATVVLRRVVSSVLLIQYDRDGVLIAELVVLTSLVGLLAALIPARRAAKVDPIVALRYE